MVPRRLPPVPVAPVAKGLPPATRTRPAFGFLALARTMVVLLAGGWGSAAVLAASLTAVLDRDTIGLGDSAVLKVTVEGGSGREAPRIPEVPGVRLVPTGSGTSFSFVNGRQSVSAEYTFAVTPGRLGTFALGPVTAVVGNQALSDGPVTLKVVRADDPALNRRDGLEKAAFLLLKPSRSEAWVGETLVAEMQLYAIGGRLQQRPQLQADGAVLGEFQEAGQEGNVRTNNTVYSRVRFVQPFTPARAGDLTLQAANCILDIPVASRGRGGGFFDEAFFGMRENRRFTLATEPVTLSVRPLPKDQVPAGFTGAVGDFALDVSASLTNLQAGDPISLRIEIAGRGNFDSVQLGDHPGWNGFRVYPATGTFQSEDPLKIEGTKRFEQVVTPESAAITEIPPVTFAYFSPGSGTYQTLRSRPIPIRVAPGAGTPAIPAPAGAPADSAPSTSKPTLPPLKPHLGVVVPAALPLARQPWFLALAALPPLAWGVLELAHARRRRRGADPEGARRAELARRIDASLATLARLAGEPDPEAFFAALFRVLQDMVAVPLGQPPASITEGVLDDALPARGVAPDTIASLHHLFQACNQARYTRVAGAADREALRQEAAAAWNALRSARV